MASSTFIERLTSPRLRSPILPLHHAPIRSSDEYQLDQLSPRPDDASSLADDLPRAWVNEQDVLGTPPRSSLNSWRNNASPPGSPSFRKPGTMFSGPPPPITASMMISKERNRQSPPTGSTNHSRNFIPRPIVDSVLIDSRPEFASPQSDSRWRGLRRQEKALEQEVQQLLDFQAAGLISGSGSITDSALNDADAFSDGSSTPTGTFYSTKSSKSRTTSSLYVPTRETADGNVIPVRQPMKDRPLGLRATRKGLRRSIMAMAKLKQTENNYLETVLAQRKNALAYLEDLSARRTDIHTELQDLDEGEEEPLGRELRELAQKCNTLDKEIMRVEEKLVAMRNRRHWLQEQMDGIKNKRDAGLSGYRGALKEVDAEVKDLMLRPPIQPLDLEVLGHLENVDGEAEPFGGVEFLRLIPERRTLEMAKSWWENEAAALESRRVRVDAHRQALEEGGAVWELVMQLVSDFESSLRQVMKLPSLSSSSSAKGKEKMPPQEETIKSQLPQMKNVMEELERHMSLAEDKHWNLLICAIGAELEAFREAYDMLESLVEAPEHSPTRDGDDGSGSQTHVEASHQDTLWNNDRALEDSDAGAPRDVSEAPAGDDTLNQRHSAVGGHSESSAPLQSPLQRSGSESENEVPPEFLMEHVLQ